MANSNPISLLIVDDEPDMLRGLARILKLRGFEVATVGSGEEAIDHVRQNKPHGILMDIRMTGIDGVEAFRRIRALAPNVFVILMTGYTKLMNEARDEGAAAILSKPVDLDEVCRLVKRTAASRPVLIVDDEPDFLASLARVLSAKAFEVYQARNMEEAIVLFDKYPRAVVLVDFMLPGCNGLEILQKIRRRNPESLIMLMSGRPEVLLQIDGDSEISASGFFLKPFDIDDLIGKIQRAVNGSDKTI